MTELSPRLPGALPSRPRKGASQRATVGILHALAAASVVVPLLILVFGGQMSWEQKRHQASDETTHLLQLVTDSTAKLFDSQVLALEQTKLLLRDATDTDVRAKQEALHDQLSFTLHFLPYLRDLFVVDKNGVPLVSGANYPAPSHALTNHDYFHYFQTGHGGRFIGRRRFGNGESAIPMAIARPSLDGGFNGIIACSINGEYLKKHFLQLLSMYPDIDGRTIALRRDDGQLVVRSGDLTPRQEQSARLGVAFLIGSSHAISGHQVSRVLGESRMVAWSRLPSLGMVIITSVSLTSVMQAWLRSMIPYALLCVASALSLLALTVVALRRTEASIAAEQQAAAERERREQAEDAVRQSQKMEALGKLTGGVAHDFNNLLAVIQGNAELAKTRKADRVPQMLDNIINASQRGAALTRQLLSFSRGQPLAPRPIDTRTELRRIITMLSPSLRGNIQVDLAIDDGVWPLELDLSEWEIALLNVAVNARDAMPHGGRLSVTARNAELSRGDVPDAPELAGSFVRLCLRDSGPGISPKVAARAFEPFFTTKDVGRGTGLGLSQVYGFAKQAGGNVTIGQAAEGGTAVTLFLPRSLRATEPQQAEAVQTRPLDANIRRILFVDDNREVGFITCDIIRTLGYDVVHVDRARKALEILKVATPGFHLLITDVVMPDGMDGVQLAQEVRQRQPSLPIILVSGYNEAGRAEATGLRLLRKPLPAHELAQAIEAELGAFPRIVVDNTKVG